MDTQRLEKFFRLLGSDNEHEAAAALRKIKSLIKDAGLTWNQFVGQISFGVTTQKKWKSEPRPADKQRADSAWEFIFQKMREEAEAAKRKREQDTQRASEAERRYQEFVREQRNRGANWDFERNKYWFEREDPEFSFEKFEKEMRRKARYKNASTDDWIKNTTKENEESLHKETTAEQREEAWNTFFKRA